MAEIPASLWIGVDEVGGTSQSRPSRRRSTAGLAARRNRRHRAAPSCRRIAGRGTRRLRPRSRYLGHVGDRCRWRTAGPPDDRSDPRRLLGGRRPADLARWDTDRLYRRRQGDRRSDWRRSAHTAVRGVVTRVDRRAAARDRRRPRSLTERDDGARRDRHRRSVAGPARRWRWRSGRGEGVPGRDACRIDVAPP